MLWTSVVPRFAAAGCLSVLLEHLLRPVLSDQLPALAPEVMQVTPQSNIPLPHMPCDRGNGKVSRSILFKTI